MLAPRVDRPARWVGLALGALLAAACQIQPPPPSAAEPPPEPEPPAAAAPAPAAAPAEPEPPPDPSTIACTGAPSDEAVERLKFHESWRSRVYRGPNGHPTVGFGHKLTPAELRRHPLGSEVPEHVLAWWIDQDLSTAWCAGYRQAVVLGEPRLADALFAVNHQLGVYWYRTHRETWRLLEEGAWHEAADEAADSLWFRQTPARVRDFQAALRGLEPSQAAQAQEVRRETGGGDGEALPSS